MTSITTKLDQTPISPFTRAAGSAGSSAISATTSKVAEHFHQYNHGLCDMFESLKNPLFRDHFKNSRKAIVAAAEGLTGTALLLGVGGALDLPLIDLAKQFDHIELVDMDTKILGEVVENMPVGIRSKFRIHSMDLTGIFTRLDVSLDKLIKDGVSHKIFCDRASEALDTIEKSPLPYPDHSASFVVSSLVSSQLSHKLNEYLDFRSREAYGEGFMRFSDTEMLKFADSLSKFEESHMRDLVSLVSPRGKIYFADHFSFENAEAIVAPGNRVLKITRETQNLYSGVKVQEFAKAHFRTLSEKKWDWTHPILASKNIMVRLADGRVSEACKETFTIFNITSLTLSP